MADIFLINLRNKPHNIDKHVYLSPEENIRAESYISENDSDLFINGRLWLRRILSCEMGCEVDQLQFKDVKGKAPIITKAGQAIPLSWSLARSDDVGVVAVEKSGRIGVDLELERDVPEWESVAAYSYSLEEQAAFFAASAEVKSDIFFRLWTAKEALTKAAGLGLAADWPKFSIDVNLPTKSKLISGDPPFLPQDWHLRPFGKEQGFYACLASDQPIETLLVQDLRM